MDRDGVDAEIIFGILGVASRVQDHEAANEMLRIYNDWLKGFCSRYPDRQIGLACLPYGDIDAAVQEVYRVAKLGRKGLELSAIGRQFDACLILPAFSRRAFGAARPGLHLGHQDRSILP